MVIRGQEGPHGSVQLLKTHRFKQTRTTFTFSPISILTSVTFCIGGVEAAAPIYNCAVVIHQNSIHRSLGSLPVQHQHGPSQAMTWPLKCQDTQPPWSEQYGILMTSSVKVSGQHCGNETVRSGLKWKASCALIIQPVLLLPTLGSCTTFSCTENAKGAFFELSVISIRCPSIDECWLEPNPLSICMLISCPSFVCCFHHRCTDCH